MAAWPSVSWPTGLKGCRGPLQPGHGPGGPGECPAGPGSLAALCGTGAHGQVGRVHPPSAGRPLRPGRHPARRRSARKTKQLALVIPFPVSGYQLSVKISYSVCHKFHPPGGSYTRCQKFLPPPLTLALSPRWGERGEEERTFGKRYKSPFFKGGL